MSVFIKRIFVTFAFVTVLLSRDLHHQCNAFQLSLKSLQCAAE